MALMLFFGYLAVSGIPGQSGRYEDRLLDGDEHDPVTARCSAALAVTQLIEDRTGRSIRKFVRAARHCRAVQVQVGQHFLTADDPLPPDLRYALTFIN